MNKLFLGLTINIIIIAVFLSFYFRQAEEPPPVTIEIVPPPQVRQAPDESSPPVQFPVPELVTKDEPVKPLPVLDESDPEVEEEFNDLVSNSQLSELLLFKTFIRNFVVIVDNLTSRILPQKYYFFRPPSGKFMVTVSGDDDIYLNPDNYQRYAAYIKLVNSLDMDRLAQVYTYLFPLFQEAYVELGYPDRYFNDRVIEVITALLQTPDIQGPVKLIQPTVYYKFADPELEVLGTGQKLLIRIGPENAAIIKARLRYLQERLTSLDGNAL